MDLRDVIAPAIEQARSGFIVRPYVAYHWGIDQGPNGFARMVDRLRFSETGRTVYFHDSGELRKPGDKVINQDLARTLERIADGGAAVFYSGDLAKEISDDMARNGGFVTRADLERYDVTMLAPLRGGLPRPRRLLLSPSIGRRTSRRASSHLE